MIKSNQSILLVGTGPMAVEHAKVLKAMGINIIAVGRGMTSANAFKSTAGIKPETGGLKNWLEKNQRHGLSQAIVAVSENELGNVVFDLLANSFTKILVEKPGGFDFEQIIEVCQEAKKRKADIFVGYNRRFYASVERAQEIIKEDGGVSSFNFEFTEWNHVITPLKKAPLVKEQWFLHNSTHVIDLAFYLGGLPEKLCSYIAGSLPWHPRASVFAGAGVSKTGALFSYQANWEAPGRWSVEILTKAHRLIFRPLEKLQIQKIGSVAVEEIPLDNTADINFKPGLLKQTQSFLTNKKRLCTIEEQLVNVAYYKKILIPNNK